MKKRIYFIAFIFVLYLSTALAVHAAEPYVIESPVSLSAEQVTDGDTGNTGILLAFTAPESVKLLGEKSLAEGDSLYYEVECRVAGYDWEPIGQVHFTEGEKIVIADSEHSLDTAKNLYSFRVRFAYYFQQGDGSFFPHYSLYSNIAHLGNRSALGAYHNASSWAIQELDRALEYSLITDKIRNEINAPITREEFCEVIMALYENMADKVVCDDTGVFSDTNNPQVYKAYKLGIVNGVGNNRFDPDALTNREQVAAMIHRAIKAMLPYADFSTDGADSFSDEKAISDWAYEPVMFMNKNGLLKGSKGKVEPKGVTTREQAVLMVVRTYEKFSLSGGAASKETGSEEGTAPQPNESPDVEAFIVGNWSTHDNIWDNVNYNTGDYVSSEYYLLGFSFKSDGTFTGIFITNSGMTKYYGSYKFIEGPTEWKNGKKVLMYNRSYEFFEPNAAIPKETGQKEDQEYEVRYNPEEDEMIIDFLGYNTLKRIK